MIKFDDYKLPGPGDKIDWSAYRKAQINIGENCYQCEGVVSYFNAPGYKELCSSCKGLKSSEDVYHDDFIRCPKCGHEENVHDRDDYEIFGDGEHDTSCNECNHKYMITTYVSYDFRSPARIEKKNEEED